MTGKKQKPKKLGLYDLALEWFRESYKDKPKILRGKYTRKVKDYPEHFRISEYQKLRFFWEEFGLNFLDLEHVEEHYPGFTEDLLLVGAAKNKVTEEQLEAARQTETAIPTRQHLGGTGRQVIRKKIL